MANRLVSVREMRDFLPGADQIDPNSANRSALIVLIEDVTARFERFLYGSTGGLKQQQFIEFYGNEHYGRSSRNVILLKRYLNISAVSSVIENGQTISPDDYTVDFDSGLIFLISSKKFVNSRRAVQVTYTAGYNEAVVSDDDDRKLDVTEDLKAACMKQVVFEWGLRTPGGSEYGDIVRADAQGTSVSVTQSEFIPQVKEALKRIKKR